MSLLDRINTEHRTIGGVLVPWQPWRLRNPFWKFNSGGPVHPSQQVSGIDSVLGLAAVYSCVRYIADAVASLPINVYRNNPDGTTTKLPSSQLLDNPSADINTTMYDWLFMCLSSALLWGNAWGLITSRTGVSSPNGLGYPQTVDWLPPDRVQVRDDEQAPENPMKAKVYYNGVLVDRQQLVHVRAFVIPGRLAAISPMRAFATLYEQGNSALEYTATWFRNGGFPPGTFQNMAEEVDETAAKEIRRRLTDTLRLHEPLVYGKDWDYKPVVVPPNEAAFVTAMQLNATQVAAVYGVPPTKVGGTRGDSLTYATQEQETLSLITDTLRPWLVRMEHLFSALLPATQFVRFNTDALLKTDLKTRTEIYQQQRNMGLKTVDEIRAIEDLPPVAGGVGNDPIPLSVLERMAATVRAVPKTILPLVSLEAQLSADLLEKMQAEGLVAPDAPGPPITTTSADYLAHQITQARSGPSRDRGIEPVEHGNAFFGPKHQLATDADRAKARKWIETATRAGCLSSTESGERISKAGSARIRGVLDELVKDLPAEQELVTERAEDQIGDRAEPPPLLGAAAQAKLWARSLQADFDPEQAGLTPAASNGKGH